MIYRAFILFLLAAPRRAASLSCYSCNNIESLDSCQTISNCGSKQLLVTEQPNIIVEVVQGRAISSIQEQSCFTRSQTIGQKLTFTMGCTNNQNCGKIPVYDTMSRKMNNERPIEQCNECCGSDKCNNNLCNHKTPPPCEDIKDCAYWNKKFDICEDIHEAKHICRKFCKLCSLVDGKWADWSSWSSCDVTCGHGKHTRIRTCTNPAPAYRGLDCKGNSTDTKPCVRPLCPVHGGWSEWSEWGSCPVTCDMGIQKRHRTCTKPYPLRYGDHCFGDTMDVKLCKEVSCDSTSSDTSVAFNAYGVTDVSPSSGQTMVFSTVLTNQGESYNNSTGVFVAPRNGTYIFHAQMCIVPAKNMHFDIMVESTSYATAYGYAYSSCECPSIQAVVELKTKERVFVQWGTTWSYGSKSVICKHYPYQKNYFSGVLNHG